jgi:hypothetical protein
MGCRGGRFYMPGDWGKVTRVRLCFSWWRWKYWRGLCRGQVKQICDQYCGSLPYSICRWCGVVCQAEGAWSSGNQRNLAHFRGSVGLAHQLRKILCHHFNQVWWSARGGFSAVQNCWVPDSLPWSIAGATASNQKPAADTLGPGVTGLFGSCHRLPY